MQNGVNAIPSIVATCAQSVRLSVRLSVSVAVCGCAGVISIVIRPESIITFIYLLREGKQLPM